MKTDSSLRTKISKFQRELPYTKLPYQKKNWGHPLHSLCSYQGKLKPSLAHWLIEYFVPEHGSVLDPLGGVGTIAFEGALSGRHAVSNDKSPFASLIARSKLSPPSLEQVSRSIERIKLKTPKTELDASDYTAAEFGLNARVRDYYHHETLISILKLRKIFLLGNINRRSDAENFMWSCLLHILHGNRPYALSRTSHPITPFSPTGPAIYKDVLQKVFERAQRSLALPLPGTFKAGTGLFGDFRGIQKSVQGTFDAVITSPPFYGMRFDRPNWLRLWFCGWTEQSFKEDSLGFLERQQVKNIGVYKDFFEVSRRSVKEDGLLVLHLGGGGKRNLSEELKELARDNFRFVGEVTEDVRVVAKHGIMDKGLTKTHSLHFFRPVS